MKSRGLLVALIVLVVLVGLWYWSNRETAMKTSAAASALPASPKILALNQTDIVKLEIKKRDGGDVVLNKNVSGAWQITSPEELAADSSRVNSLISTLSSLSGERVVAEKGADLQVYGLAPPSAEFIITENGDKTQQLLIGDDTPTRSGAYASLAGDPRIFTIASYTKSSVDKGLSDLRDKRFFTLDSDKINRLELLEKNADLEFDHHQDRWQIVKPRSLRADSAAIDGLVSSLTTARIDLGQSSEDQHKIASSFARAENVGTVRLISDAGTQELNVRKIGKDYYAKSSVQDAPYKVSNDVALEFSKPTDAFRNKDLFDFGYSDPAKIEFKDGAKSYFLTKGGADWWGPDGKKLDAAQADSLVEKLRELKAKAFVESGFGNPQIEVTVTPGNSGSAEKVTLSKSGNSYIGRREGDPSLYQLDSQAVEDLEHAAAELKPAGK